MVFIIAVRNGGAERFIKRTSFFGYFHGNIVLTAEMADAFRFTRKRDAESREQVFRWRIAEYDFDEKKFGGSTTEIREVA